MNGKDHKCIYTIDKHAEQEFSLNTKSTTT